MNGPDTHSQLKVCEIVDYVLYPVCFVKDCVCLCSCVLDLPSLTLLSYSEIQFQASVTHSDPKYCRNDSSCTFKLVTAKHTPLCFRTWHINQRLCPPHPIRTPTNDPWLLTSIRSATVGAVEGGSTRQGLIRSDCGELCITAKIGNTCCDQQRE